MARNLVKERIDEVELQRLKKLQQEEKERFLKEMKEDKKEDKKELQQNPQMLKSELEMREDNSEDSNNEEKENISPVEKVVYVTTEQIMLHNLNIIMGRLDNVEKKILDGFKQVGAEFKD